MVATAVGAVIGTAIGLPLFGIGAIPGVAVGAAIGAAVGAVLPTATYSHDQKQVHVLENGSAYSLTMNYV